MKIVKLLKDSDAEFRRNLSFFLLAYFFVLFNYPLIRASTTALFFQEFGAKSSPSAWLWSVGFLTVSIFFSNKLQSKFTVQKVFLFVGLFSSLIFLTGVMGVHDKFFAYGAFIWKEIYIVIQVHLLLAYANSCFSREDFKILVGPIGAIGSLGGVFGGLATSALSSHGGTLFVMWAGLIFVLLPAFFFQVTPSLLKMDELRKKKSSPLASLNTPEIRKYVAHIAMIVALTQFIINIADFRFNLVFEASILDSSSRIESLGHIYTVTNLITLLFQFILLPFLLPRITEKNLHLAIPLSYLICVSLMMVGQGIGLVAVSSLYIYFKATDYSLFSAAKEILYQPLEVGQKYGAKYLTDMLTYRFSKALIAAVLIYLQSSAILNMLMIIFILLWVILVINLFHMQRKLFF